MSHNDGGGSDSQKELISRKISSATTKSDSLSAVRSDNDETSGLMASDEFSILRTRVVELEEIVRSRLPDVKGGLSDVVDNTSEKEENDDVEISPQSSNELGLPGQNDEEIGPLSPTEQTKKCNSEDDDNEYYRNRKLSPDTFSFLIFAPVKSSPFIWSMTIFLLQILTFTLVAVDVIDTNDADNPLGIPANVDVVVRVTQLVAIVVAVATQEDLRTSLNLLYDGYHNSNLDQMFDGVSRGKWRFAICCRFLEGALGLLATFFLIVIESTVIDLLLNFTAMEFVSQLDDVAFFFAKEGYVGRKNRNAAVTVANTTYSMTRLRGRRIQRVLLLLLILAIMLAGWGWVFHQQQSGAYLCDTIFVQFGDEALATLGFFTGLYDIVRTGRGGFASYQMSYIERRSGKAQVGYCSTLNAWTFTYNMPDAGSDGSIDACEWQARSPESSSYDVLDTATTQWVATSQGRDIELEHFRLLCFECTAELCGIHGTCSNSACTCDADYYGLRCEFPQPCPTISIDLRTQPFPGTRDWSRQYKTFVDSNNELVQVYDRPVYINEFSPGAFDLIMYTGRRWVVTFSGFLLQEVDSFDTTTGLAEYLRTFHGFYSSTNFGAFVSEAVDVGTPTDGVTPEGLFWFADLGTVNLGYGLETIDRDVTNFDSVLPIDTNLLCGCNNISSPCLFGGFCGDGVCSCPVGSSGSLCEVPPVGNGRCDMMFNTQAFSFDGGDCCESTCVSSTEFLCGEGDTDAVDIGYFFCMKEVNTWEPNSLPVLAEQTYAQSGWSVALSGSGNVLAIGERGTSSVRTFAKFGSEWRQRGPPLVGPQGFTFGYDVAFSAGLNDVVPTRFAVPPIVLAAAGEAGSAGSVIRVYDCINQRCRQLGNDIQGEFNFFSSLSISRTGGTVAASGAQVIDWDATENEWKQRAKIIVPGGVDETQFARYVSLSGNGGVLAVGTLDRDENFVYTLVTRVYAWNGEKWLSQGGEVLRSTHFPPDETGRVPRESLSLSSDARVLAVGSQFGDTAKPGVKIFVWTGSSWEQRGSVISDPDGNSGAGFSVALSSKGSIVTMGTNNLGSNVYALKWNGTEYEQLWNGIPGGQFSSVAISDDGSTVAVGLPIDRGGGSTTTYSFVTSPQCRNGTSLLRLSVTMDDAPEQTWWEVVNGTGDVLLQGGPYYDGYTGSPTLVSEFTSFVQETCVDINDCTSFHISHHNARGIRAPGGYTVFLDGQKIGSGGNTEGVRVEQLRIGNCSCMEGEMRLTVTVATDTKPQQTSWDLTDESGQILLSGGPYSPVEGLRTFVRAKCVPADTCATFTIQDAYGTGICCADGLGSYAISIDDEPVASGSEFGFQESVQLGNCPPTITPTAFVPLVCDAGFIAFRLELTTNQFADETSWNLVDGSGEILLQGGPYNPETDGGETFVSEACIASNDCATFTITDAYGDGLCCLVGQGEYVLFLGDAEVHRGGEFGDSETVRLGDCAPTSSPTFDPILCEEGSLGFRVELSLDNFPQETLWTVVNGSGQVLLQGGPYQESNKRETIIVDGCLPIDSCATFVIFDTEGDGICCGSGFCGVSLFVGEDRIEIGGEFGAQASAELGNCTASAEATP